MTVQPTATSALPEIAYFQIFRVYHSAAQPNATHYLFGNSRQRIALTIEVLARDAQGRKVDLSPRHLAALRLVEVDQYGSPTGPAIAHEADPETLTGWSTYAGPSEYVYDERLVKKLGKGVVQDDRRAPEATGHDALAIETDRAQIWVATSKSDTKRFAAKLGNFVSSEQDIQAQWIRLAAVKVDTAKVDFEHQEERAYSGLYENARGYNNYIQARTSDGEKIKLKYISMPGIWWDRGEKYLTEYSFCVSAHAGQTQMNSEGLPPYLNPPDNVGIKFHPLEMMKPREVVKPREDEVVIIMFLDPTHWQFRLRDFTQAEDKEVHDGDITDVHGNVYPLRFRYSITKVDLIITKR
ncbi:hypothetical protein [Pseudomonas putida]|uniref:Uncharacterized protein n=1 Tax=Pseudomonas putida TaxID=303 RepID=A0A1X0ZQL6_PSEPU|nr:hypothetical protein [Pseudomonas putida]ORL61126.1 hypothetical protein B7H17_21315 [Pseudomonas putida]